MLSTAQSAAGGAFLMLGGAVAWLLLSEFPVADPGKPTTSASPLMLLEAAVPSIGDFADFNINTENPFVPAHLRKAEQKAINDAKSPRPPKIPVVAQVETPKPRELPRLPAPGTTGPRATGVLISKDGIQALMTFPGQAKAALMKPGDTANGWTLVEVLDGNVVRMKEDATGTVHNLVVPESIAVHKAAAKPVKPDATKTDAAKTNAQKPAAQSPSGQKPDGGGQQPGGQKPADGRQPHGMPGGQAQPGDRPQPQLAPPPPPEKMM